MKEKVIEILTRLQIDNPFIISIYLWGSITTDEYQKGISDIDALAFVEESTDISEKNKLNDALSKEFSGLKINFLYLSELNGGPLKGGLTKVINPAVILYDFPAWIYVCGKKIEKRNFFAGRILLEEVIRIASTEIKRRFLPIPIEQDYIYFIKALAKLLYFINQQRSPFKVFRYGDLISDTYKENLEIAQLIFEIKKSNWDSRLIREKIPDCIFLATEMLSRY